MRMPNTDRTVTLKTWKVAFLKEHDAFIDRTSATLDKLCGAPQHLLKVMTRVSGLDSRSEFTTQTELSRPLHTQSDPCRIRSARLVGGACAARSRTMCCRCGTSRYHVIGLLLVFLLVRGAAGKWYRMRTVVCAWQLPPPTRRYPSICVVVGGGHFRRQSSRRRA